MVSCQKDEVKLQENTKERAFVSALDEIEEYVNCQQRLSQKLKEGLFNLSKAKYNLGTLGQINYSANAEAQVTTAVEESGVDDNEEDVDLYSQFSLVRLEDEAVKKDNPLHWFSALPPLSLREAQKNFTEVVRICVDLANSSQRIRSALDTWEEQQGKGAKKGTSSATKISHDAADGEEEREEGADGIVGKHAKKKASEESTSVEAEEASAREDVL